MNERSWALARRAEEAARRELERIPEWLWDGRSVPVPVELLADSHYGLLVEEEPDLRSRLALSDHAHVSGLLLPAERLIVVDEEEAARAPGRRRFTIGHELGHWVLHRSPGSEAPVYCRDVGVREQAAGEPEPAAVFDYPPSELEANQFAAAMLLPRELLLSQRRPTSNDEEYALARVFGVSREALLRRLWSLDHGL